MNKVQEYTKEWLEDQWWGINSHLTDLECYDLQDLNYTYREYNEDMNCSLDFYNMIRYLTTLVEDHIESDKNYEKKQTAAKLLNYDPGMLSGLCPTCGYFNERNSGEFFDTVHNEDACVNCGQVLDEMIEENETWEIEQSQIELLQRQEKEQQMYMQEFMNGELNNG